MSTRFIDTADVAKLVRAELKAAFPGTKFSVRSSRYSMGSEVSVKWVDGPTSKAVYGVVGMFCGSSFDGSVDLRSSHDTNYKGELVHFCNTSLDCTRELSVEFVKPIAEKVAKLWGFETPEVLESFGHAYIKQDYSQRIGRDCLANVIMQAAHETDARFPEQEETEEPIEEVITPEETAPESPVSETPQTEGYTVVYENNTTWIEFPAKPAPEILKALKDQLGARWNRARKAWWIGRIVALGEIITALGSEPTQDAGIDEIAAIRAILDNAGWYNGTPYKGRILSLVERVALLVDDHQGILEMLLGDSQPVLQNP